MSALKPAVKALEVMLRERSHPTSAPEIYDLLGEAHEVTYRLGSLLDRLALEMADMSTDPRLRADELTPRPAGGAGEIAEHAGGTLWAAHDLLRDAAASIETGRQRVSHLYHDVDDHNQD